MSTSLVAWEAAAEMKLMQARSPSRMVKMTSRRRDLTNSQALRLMLSSLMTRMRERQAPKRMLRTRERQAPRRMLRTRTRRKLREVLSSKNS